MRLKKLAPGRFIALSFATAVLLGAVLLSLPAALNPGVTLSPLDALFTATSAVCVTGLVVADTAATYSAFGRAVIAVLIQVGGLGLAAIGAMFILLAGRKVNLRERTLVKEALNHTSYRGIVGLLKSVLLTTLAFELAGTLLSLITFSRHYPFWEALGVSAFHSIASFNNAGFDILGNMESLAPYRGDVLLNLVTCALVVFGGLGFFVIRDLALSRSVRKLSLHSKVVLSVSGALLLAGTVLLRVCEDMDYLSAFFYSASARTAGFSLHPLNGLSNAGLMGLMALMFVGASPGSTGGGVKTTTLFVAFKAVGSASTHRQMSSFRRTLTTELAYRAFLTIALGLVVVVTCTFALCLAEPGLAFSDLLFESVSAFATVGLSTGVTPHLGAAGKLILILTMYVGRLGPVTAACLWSVKTSADVSYAQDTLPIG